MTYKNWFLSGLLFASFIPAVVSVLNFDITNQSVAAFAFMFSLLSIMGGAHVWLTLAYYADREWLAHFRKFPMVFFVAPAIIMIAMTAMVAQPSRPIGLTAVYGITFVNLWHHSKQNWGVLSLVGKARRAKVIALKNPLIYAWPFFLAAWCLQLPGLADSIGVGHLKAASVVCALAFAAFVAWSMWQGQFFQNKDPLVLAFGIVLACYFMPMILLAGKPYALAIWASAHGMQYYFMVLMSLSMKRRTESALPSVATTVILSLGILAALTVASWLSTQASGADYWSSVTTRTIVGAVIGINLVHFWIDAFIWRFSDAEIRKRHGEAFAF